LIDRLSPSTYTGTQSARRDPEPAPSELSPKRLLDMLMRSDVLPGILSSGTDVPMDTPGDEQNDVVNVTSKNVADNVCILRLNLHAMM
jgi:hypothetical protein